MHNISMGIIFACHLQNVNSFSVHQVPKLCNIWNFVPKIQKLLCEWILTMIHQNLTLLQTVNFNAPKILPLQLIAWDWCIFHTWNFWMPKFHFLVTSNCSHSVAAIWICMFVFAPFLPDKAFSKPSCQCCALWLHVYCKMLKSLHSMSAKAVQSPWHFFVWKIQKFFGEQIWIFWDSQSYFTLDSLCAKISLCFEWWISMHKMLPLQLTLLDWDILSFHVWNFWIEEFCSLVILQCLSCDDASK